MKSLAQKFLVVSLFAITMGFLEAIVVVYLRGLYYPEGFHFPLVTLSPGHFDIEIVREAATIIMLICVGLLAGKTNSERFGWFLFVFGIWDIFYYIGLELTLNWPASFLTWDILFLIPIAWIGPVLAPIICALTMISISFFIIYFESNGYSLNFGKYTWTLFIFGSVIIVVSFIESTFMLLYFEGFFNIFSNDFSQSEIEKSLANFVPDKFNWLLFSIGEFFIIGGAFHLIRQYLRKYKNNKPIKNIVF